MNPATIAIHKGQKPDPTTGAIIPPIYLTSTYVQSAPGVHQGYEYTRSDNPTFSNAETTLAALEHGQHALIYSSWLGAMTTVMLSLLQNGDQVVINNDVYGGTFRLLDQVFSKFGITYTQVDTDDTTQLEQALAQPSTKMVRVESPTNPLLKTTNITQLAQLARKHNVISVVDNTFATPIFQQPLTQGIDIVVHSTTKYLSWHSDIIGGATITNNPDYHDAFNYHRNAAGINPNAFDARLLSRSLKTLDIRMQQHYHNAKQVAAFLQQHPLVSRVYRPDMSGIVSVEFDLSIDQTKQLISSFSLFRLAESLGGVESLVDHPATMTHGSIPRDIRIANGLTDGLVRLSVGIEHSDDLLHDLTTTLATFQ